MPLDEGLGLDDDQGVAPIEEPGERDHRQPGCLGSSARFRFTLLEQPKLAAQE